MHHVLWVADVGGDALGFFHHTSWSAREDAGWEGLVFGLWLGYNLLDVKPRAL